MSQRTILLELESAERGGYVVGCCKLLGVRTHCSYSFPHRSDHDVPVNLQQHKMLFPIMQLCYLCLNGRLLDL